MGVREALKMKMSYSYWSEAERKVKAAAEADMANMEAAPIIAAEAVEFLRRAAKK